MFVESVVALIPDHEVRAAKLTNRWISGCWWGRDASSDEHLVGTKHGLLKCRSVRRKPPGEQWSRRETVEAGGTKWDFDVGMDTGIPGPPLESRRDEERPSATAQRKTPLWPPRAHPAQPGSDTPENRGQGVHAKALRIRAFWSEIGRAPGCPPCPGKSHTREAKHFKMPGTRVVELQRRKRGVAADPDTRPLDPSGSSMDPELKRTTTPPWQTLKNLADRMDEDNLQRTLLSMRKRVEQSTSGKKRSSHPWRGECEI